MFIVSATSNSFEIIDTREEYEIDDYENLNPDCADDLYVD